MGTQKEKYNTDFILRFSHIENVLLVDKRKTFTEWMRGNATEDKRIRVSVPKVWKIGDKSGAGGHAMGHKMILLSFGYRIKHIIIIISSRDMLPTITNSYLGLSRLRNISITSL